MGYTTSFTGKFKLDRPLSPEHAAYLKAFADVRHILWWPGRLDGIPDPVREAAGLPLGPEGIYFVGHNDESRGQAVYERRNESVLDKACRNSNSTPHPIPGLWNHWVPTDDLKGIEWDGGEKFYYYGNWLVFIIGHFLEPWGYVLNGSVKWKGEDRGDRGTLTVKNNVFSGKPMEEVFRSTTHRFK